MVAMRVRRGSAEMVAVGMVRVAIAERGATSAPVMVAEFVCWCWSLVSSVCVVG